MRVRVAPGPTGSLEIGAAVAAGNRNLGGTMLHRIDTTDPQRNRPGGEAAILDDLGWLGIAREEGPLAELPAPELAMRLAVPERVVPALRGARDLNETGAVARTILELPAVSFPDEGETLDRFRAPRAGVANGLDPAAAKPVVRGLKALGGHLRALREAPAGRESGPPVVAVIAALPRDEALRRVDAAL